MDELFKAEMEGDLAAILLINMHRRRGFHLGNVLEEDIIAWWREWQQIVKEKTAPSVSASMVLPGVRDVADGAT